MWDRHSNPAGYPALERDDLLRNFGDPVERVRWRSRHVLDYASILDRCYDERTSHVLILEDDLKPAHHLDTKVAEVLRTVPDPAFGLVTLYSGNSGGAARGVVNGLRRLTTHHPLQWCGRPAVGDGRWGDR